MPEYFAGKMLRASIGHAKSGVRDLRNSDLSVFYDGPSIPSSQIDRNVAEVQSLHQSAGIEPISSSAFAAQAGSPSQQFFIDFLRSSGIEVTFEDDIAESPTASLVPALGFRTSFIQEQASVRPLTVPAIREALRHRASPTRAVVQHFRQTDPLVVADSDPYVRPKLRRMRQFVARYLTP